jgi:hypothetical protein
VVRLAVIEQNFLSRLDVTQSEKENVAVDDFAVTVRFAGMIDELRAVADAVSVNRPVKINAAYIKASFILQPSRDFMARDPFACVFSDLAPLFEGNGGEAAQAIDPRRFDFKTGGESYLLYPASSQSIDNAR